MSEFRPTVLAVTMRDSERMLEDKTKQTNKYQTNTSRVGWTRLDRSELSLLFMGNGQQKQYQSLSQRGVTQGSLRG